MQTVTQTVTLNPVSISPAVLQKLADAGLIALFRPTVHTQTPPPGDNVAESLYESAEGFGPHKLIAVGVGKTQVRLGVHPDNEEFLLPPHGVEGESVRPLYLLIAHLPQDELLARDAAGTLSGEDFTCLSLYPAPRGAEMFTMRAGTVHCEVTVPSDAPVGCFYVTEARDLPIDWVDLPLTRFVLN
jgi:hypothetical protein